jgi:Cytochrome c554 and c-prime
MHAAHENRSGSLAAFSLAAGLALLPVPAGRCGRSNSRVGADVTTSERPSLTIVLTSDVGGELGSLARRATLVDEARAQSGVLVQVDAGGLLPTLELEGLSRRARLLLAAYARMGVDALIPGKSELALGPDKLRSLANAAGVPVLAANLVSANGETVFPALRVVQTGNWPIGIFGIVEFPEAESAIMSPWGLRTTDPIVAARAAVASLHAQGAKFVIGCLHVPGGTARAHTIAALSGAVDVVVLSHGGDPENQGIGEGTSRRVFLAGQGGGTVGRIDVRTVGGRRVMQHRELHTANVPEQVGVALLLRIDAAPVLAHPPEDAPKPHHGIFERWTYASTNGCALCHEREVQQWMTTDHAHAFATLRDAGRATDPACLGCHMTGFLRPGGTQYLDTATISFPDVGCEACHGPSADHVGSVNKKTGTSRTVDPVVCLGCHAPDQSVEPFDYAAARQKIIGPGHGL